MAIQKKKAERRVKLLVSIINKEDEEKLTETLNRTCVSMHFSGIGHGTARSSYRTYFGFNEIEKRVVFSLIPDSSDAFDHTILNAVGKSLRLYLLGRGIAFTTPLSGISNIIEEAVLSTPDKEQPKGARSAVTKKEKTTMHELVIAVVHEKFTDAAIEAARSAGATGATVFHTRSIDNSRIEQSMGTALPEETDTLFFLTSAEYKLKIMEAVRDTAGLKTDGSAVIFSVPVDDIVGIGRFDGEVDIEQ